MLLPLLPLLNSTNPLWVHICSSFISGMRSLFLPFPPLSRRAPRRRGSSTRARTYFVRRRGKRGQRRFFIPRPRSRRAWSLKAQDFLVARDHEKVRALNKGKTLGEILSVRIHNRYPAPISVYCNCNESARFPPPTSSDHPPFPRPQSLIECSIDRSSPSFASPCTTIRTTQRSGGANAVFVSRGPSLSRRPPPPPSVRPSETASSFQKLVVRSFVRSFLSERTTSVLRVTREYAVYVTGGRG